MSSPPDWMREGRDWPNRSASRFVETSRLRFHVQEMGEGPILLLLHGTGAATHSWRDLMPLLAKQFTVIAPDLPGHGFTTGRPRAGLTLPAMASSIGELLRSISAQPALVAGHSAGAAVALQLILDGAVRAPVIGLNPALTPFQGFAAQLFPAAARMLFVNPLVPHIFAGIARVPGEVERVLRRSTGSRIDERGVALYARLFACAGHCAGTVEMMANWDLDRFSARLDELDTPVLLLHGERDRAVPEESVKAAQARVNGSELDTLAGLGHLMHEEAPAAVAERIVSYAAAQGILAAEGAT